MSINIIPRSQVQLSNGGRVRDDHIVTDRECVHVAADLRNIPNYNSGYHD